MLFLESYIILDLTAIIIYLQMSSLYVLLEVINIFLGKFDIGEDE